MAFDPCTAPQKPLQHSKRSWNTLFGHWLAMKHTASMNIFSNHNNKHFKKTKIIMADDDLVLLLQSLLRHLLANLESTREAKPLRI